jgi:membrane protease YdiL (CAAX protease family)
MIMMERESNVDPTPRWVATACAGETPAPQHRELYWGLLGSGHEPFLPATRILMTRGDELMDEIANAGVADGEIEEAPPPDRPSLIRRIFRNRFGHWRAGWRMLVYIIVAYIAGKALGLGFSRGWPRELAVGVAGGLIATGLLVLILIATGSVSLSLSPDLSTSLGALPFFLVLFTLAAAVEELLFRGYFLQSLAEGSRRWIATLLLCIPFTWGHADNPDVTIIGITNIFLAGVILVILYFQTRRLWLPIGFHVSWNLAQSWLWGFDVSGIKIQDQLFVMNPTGAEYLTGGEFGLEGSALSTVLFVVLVAWLLWKKVLTPTDEVAAMWAAYPVGFGMAPAILPERDAPPTIQTPASESRGAAEHS